SKWRSLYNYVPEVLNVGGGFGIRYTAEESPLPHHTYIEEIVASIQHHVEILRIPMLEIWMEPGRAIAGNAGITLYTIGSMKQITGVRNYISVDGGMTDNLRPALYQAKYEAVLANKATLPTTNTVSVAGKCCESGDMLIWDLP